MKNSWQCKQNIRLAWMPLLLCFTIAVSAQNDSVVLRTDAQLKTFYQQRENQAPQQVKTNLATLRERIKKNKLTFTVGYTEASARALNELAGESDQVSASEVSRVKKMMQNRQKDSGDMDGDGSAVIPAKWDSRTKKWVSGIRDQKNCGSCWGFSAVGAYESNWLKRYGGGVNTSEQQVLDCSGGGSCGGGLSYKVFDWMVDNKKNLKTEVAYPYVAKKKACPTAATSTNYFAKSWKVLRSDGDITKIADVKTIKQAILKYGAVCASLYVNGDWGSYTGGVLNGMPSNTTNPKTNHAILIIGWDDTKKAFLVKNSWGTDWGINGYCWVKYNNYNIGRRASVVVAQKP